MLRVLATGLSPNAIPPGGKKRGDVMLRISVESLSDATVTLRLEGRVSGLLVSEVRQNCEQFLAAGCRLTLDLAEVEFADRSGVALLQGLKKRDVTLVNCSPFLREQLKAAASLNS
jgi:anti-anti-sigma regulatory factor